jgi:hypothetical protein
MKDKIWNNNYSFICIICSVYNSCTGCSGLLLASRLGAGGSVSYSVGQGLYTTNTGSTGSLVQGVQQAEYYFWVIEAYSIAVFCGGVQIRLRIKLYCLGNVDLLWTGTLWSFWKISFKVRWCKSLKPSHQ